MPAHNLKFPPTGGELARTALRYLLASFYVAAGVWHLSDPKPFLLITPSWAPFPDAVIAITGVCEICGGLGLLTRPARMLAGMGLALYAVCVYPANVKQAIEAIDVPGLPHSWWYHGPRLAFQPVLVWLALFTSETTTWPFRMPPSRRVDGPV